MDSSSKNSTSKASAVQSVPAAPSASASSARPVPMRMLATAGILVGFATGLALNLMSPPQGRAIIAKAQAAITHTPASVKHVALVETAPVIVAED